jgi:aminoglycoside phosphotransferase (APT) family kinase protein
MAEGFHLPPPSDRELNVQIVHDVLREQFPELALDSIEFLGSGWENDAYLVDRRVVVRFPRYADISYGYQREAPLLTIVADAAGDSAAIPRIGIWGRPSPRFPHAFVGHQLIAGVAADHPGVPRTMALADDLGRALTRIHAIPAAKANAADVKVDTTRCREPRDELLRQLPDVPEIERTATAACAWVRDDSVVPPDYDGEPRFIHNDFSSDHIIVDPATGRLSGIIDWSDAVLGDPAQDFAYLMVYHGCDFLERTISAYRLPVDSAFVERCVFLARVRAIGWLAHDLERGAELDLSLKAIRNSFGT